MISYYSATPALVLNYHEIPEPEVNCSWGKLLKELIGYIRLNIMITIYNKPENCPVISFAQFFK